MAHVLVHTIGFITLAGGLWLSGWVLANRFGNFGPWHGLVALCLGFAWWIPSLFLLAAASCLHLGGLVFAALPLLALAAFQGFEKGQRLAPDPRKTERPQHPVTLWLFAGLLAVVLLFTFFLTLSPQITWDADVYHLTLPRLFVEQGGFRNVEMSVYSHWPLGTELLFAAAMLVDDYILAKTVHFGFALATVYALILAFAHGGVGTGQVGKGAYPCWDGRLAGLLAATLFLANSVVAWEMSKAYVDLAHSFFFLTTFLFLHLATETDEKPRSFLLLAGLCGGLMASIKVTGILGVAMIAVAFLPQLARAGLKTGPFLTRFALPVALLWIPWLLKATWYTGNPLYPLFHPLLGGPDWSSSLAERFGHWQSSIGMGRGPLDYLLLPFRIFLVGERGYARFDGELSPFWLVLIPLAMVLGRRQTMVRQALAVTGLYFFFWALSSQQIRFLIPVLPLLALASADAMLRLVGRLPAWAGRQVPIFVIAGVLVLSVHLPFMTGGFHTLVTLLRFQDDPVASVVPEHHGFIGDHLPEGSRILFLNTNLGFFCSKEYLADSFFEASQIADWLADANSVEAIRQRLEQRHITHILVDKRPRVDHFPAALGRLLSDVKQVEPLFLSSDGRFVVSRLRPAPVQTSGAGGSGNSTKNVVPLPSSVSRDICPPIPSTNPLTIERPRPEPPALRVAEESTWVNRSKRRERNSSGIPGP